MIGFLSRPTPALGVLLLRLCARSNSIVLPSIAAAKDPKEYSRGRPLPLPTRPAYSGFNREVIRPQIFRLFFTRSLRFPQKERSWHLPSFLRAFTAPCEICAYIEERDSAEIA
jgi:hypothetical protein